MSPSAGHVSLGFSHVAFWDILRLVLYQDNRNGYFTLTTRVVTKTDIICGLLLAGF